MMTAATLIAPAIVVLALGFPTAAAAQLTVTKGVAPLPHISRDGSNRPCLVPAGACSPGPYISIRVGRPPLAVKPDPLRLRVAGADWQAPVMTLEPGTLRPFTLRSDPKRESTAR